MKESEETISVLEAEIQLEIERVNDKHKILEDLVKKHENIRKPLSVDGKISGVRLDLGKPIPPTDLCMISNIKKEKCQKATDIQVELNK